jgi:dipeptidyl aminopeptidase/acylaminoacyl peptidase
MNGRPFAPPAVRPYGTWASGLDAATVARGGVRFLSPSTDGDDVYWIERRPDERGRHVLVRALPDGRRADVSPPGSNIRSRVHEYGEPAYVVRRGHVHYVELTDQRLYSLEPGSTDAVAVTPEGPWRYADLDRHPFEPLMACVREDHSRPEMEPVTAIVVLDLRTETAGEVVVDGHDFYAYPRFSPDGTRLLWIGWRHPQMPWDGTELWVADLVRRGGVVRLTNAQLVAGGESESIFQPGWISAEAVAFVSDRTGWWNLYRADLVRDRFESGPDSLHPMAAEFGRPLWRLGDATWAPAGAGRMVVSFVDRGWWHLGLMDTDTGALADVPCGLWPGGTIVATNDAAVFVGQSRDEPDSVVRLDLTTGEVERLSERRVSWPVREIATAEAITFPTSDDQIAHAFLYRPKNAQFEAPADERPPLIVISHGGPTGAASTALDLEVQYWTSRGFAVVDVDYRGSTGYGRAFRAALNGRWGVADVDDCVNAARYLADAGLVDPARMLIRGASSGGYTTYVALISHPGLFRAGASYFGVSDLEALLRDTHKFEARYLDTLVGPYPDARDLYVERSPIHAVDRLSAPLILFQGLDDRIVPPQQTELMAEALRRKALPVAVLMFEGEPHGFRRAETIRRCLEAELYFYGVVLNFVPADVIDPVPIENV